MITKILKTSEGAKAAWVTRGKGGKEPSYEINHSTHSGAMNEAYNLVRAKGFHISDENWQHHVANTPKPGSGKTNRYSIPLHQGGNETNKFVHVQVYNKGSHVPNNYELNAYVDSGKPSAKKLETVLKDSKASTKAWATRNKSKPATHQAEAKPTEELFSDKHITALTNAMSGVTTVNPSSAAYRKMIGHLDAMGPGKLKQIAHARIPFMSSLARNRLVRKK